MEANLWFVRLCLVELLDKLVRIAQVNLRFPRILGLFVTCPFE